MADTTTAKRRGLQSLFFFHFIYMMIHPNVMSMSEILLTYIEKASRNVPSRFWRDCMSGYSSVSRVEKGDMRNYFCLLMMYTQVIVRILPKRKASPIYSSKKIYPNREEKISWK
jgi:hypothetical protein